MPKGQLLLLPNLFEEGQPHEPLLPSSVALAIPRISGLIAESEKGGRRYLRRFLSREKMALLPIHLLNEHTAPLELEALLEPLERGEAWGLISDAGLPCIADPGAELVWRARQKGIEIETFVGPCSLLLALQLSGFSGQRFCFHGYLPREEPLLAKTLQELEKRCREETQLWIEAPYRVAKMLLLIKQTLQRDTCLCIASNLTLPTQRIASFPIEKWLQFSFPLEKEPAVFLLYRR